MVLSKTKRSGRICIMIKIALRNLLRNDKIIEDSYTESILENIKIDEEIPENTFTLQNLEKR
jgi:hypothetical protein